MFETNRFVLEQFLQTRFRNEPIKYIGSGWSSHAFRIGDYIVRFPKQNVEDYLFEEEICKHLKKCLSCKTPSVKVVMDEKFPYAIHKCIEGSTIQNLEQLFESELFIKDCAITLAQIHSFHMIGTIRSAPTDIEPDIYNLNKRLSQYFNYTSAEKMCYLYNEIKTNNTEELVFIHADFHLGNIIINADQHIEGIIDWCNAGMGVSNEDFKFLFFKLTPNQMNALIGEYNNWGFSIDISKIREKALIDIIDKIYWSDVEEITDIYLSIIKDKYNEFIFK